MTNESNSRLNIRALWGDIQAAVNERVTTAELWQRANAAAQSRGFDGVTGSAIEMGELRAAATRIRNSREVFARAAGDAEPMANWAAPDINARSLPGISLTPVYRVRFQQSVQTLTGQLVSTYRTTSFPLQLPSTKDALLAELEADAKSLAEQYGELHINIFDVEITVV